MHAIRRRRRRRSNRQSNARCLCAQTTHKLSHKHAKTRANTPFHNQTHAIPRHNRTKRVDSHINTRCRTCTTQIARKTVENELKETRNKLPHVAARARRIENTYKLTKTRAIRAQYTQNRTGMKMRKHAQTSKNTSQSNACEINCAKSQRAHTNTHVDAARRGTLRHTKTSQINRKQNSHARYSTRASQFDGKQILLSRWTVRTHTSSLRDVVRVHRSKLERNKKSKSHKK